MKSPSSIEIEPNKRRQYSIVGCIELFRKSNPPISHNKQMIFISDVNALTFSWFSSLLGKNNSPVRQNGKHFSGFHDLWLLRQALSSAILPTDYSGRGIDFIANGTRNNKCIRLNHRAERQMNSHCGNYAIVSPRARQSAVESTFKKAEENHP